MIFPRCFRTRIFAAVCLASLTVVSACIGMPRQQSSAYIKALTDQCDQGNYASCFSLGTKYMTGIDVTRDAGRAAKLYQRACDHGNAQGCSGLGFFYKIGAGVAQDMERAVTLCRMGCERGDGLGCAFLAGMYETGEGVPKDMATAVSFYQLGCDKGNPMACAELGRMYFNGTGVPKDEERAVKLFLWACNQHEDRGCTGLVATTTVDNPSRPGLPLHSTVGGVDLGPYVTDVYDSVNRIFLANVPESLVKGEKGIVVVRFKVQKDGALVEESLTVESSSGKKEMDEAALKAVRTAAPFGRFPEAFPKPDIYLRFSFYYNTSP
jgi:TonB family protein